MMFSSALHQIVPVSPHRYDRISLPCLLRWVLPLVFLGQWYIHRTDTATSGGPLEARALSTLLSSSLDKYGRTERQLPRPGVDVAQLLNRPIIKCSMNEKYTPID